MRGAERRDFSHQRCGAIRPVRASGIVRVLGCVGPLRDLVAIATERSFRGAADRLGYVQSAVSQQLSALERLVGARLVERERGHASVQLTDAGVVLLHHAERILRQLSAAKADLRAAESADGGGVMRVGVFESVAVRIIPEALSQLRARNRDLEVLTAEASGDGDLFDMVADGCLDCAFADLPLEPGPFESVQMLVDPCVLLVHDGSPLARRAEPPTLHEIAALPLATHNWRIFGLVEQRFRIAGLDLAPAYALKSNSSVQALVAAGLAAAIMPRLSAESGIPGCTTIDLEGLLPASNVVLYWHRDRTRKAAMAPFVEECRLVSRQIETAWLRDSQLLAASAISFPGLLPGDAAEGLSGPRDLLAVR